MLLLNPQKNNALERAPIRRMDMKSLRNLAWEVASFGAKLLKDR